MKRRPMPAILFFTLLLISGCKSKDNVGLPSVSTLPVVNILFTTAISGGTVTDDGNTDIISKGVCWSISPEPTVNNSKTTDGTGVGEYVSNITGLTAGTLYYVRAYATNSEGTSYGQALPFTTSSAVVPTITTAAVTAIAATTATTGGSINNDGGSDITARGVVWSTSTGPALTDFQLSSGSGKGSFVSNLTGLTPSTLYYVRAYATNSSGTAYGNEIFFTTGTQQAANAVSIEGMAFNPPSLTVPVNTTVTWTNNDGITHTVTSDTGVFSSGNIGGGGTFSFTFTTAGTFPYHCSIHTEMVAIIIVQ